MQGLRLGYNDSRSARVHSYMAAIVTPSQRNFLRAPFTLVSLFYSQPIHGLSSLQAIKTES